MIKLGLCCLVIFSIISCKSPEARRPISVKSGSFVDASIERNIQLYENEKIRFQEIMDADPEQDYLRSQNGFWYTYNIKKDSDTLPKPDFGDVVNFDYNVKTINGDMVYTNAETKPDTYIMDKQELFTGLREGLKLMKAGETATFLFPSAIAYGYYGDQNKINTNTPLICRVTIHSITEN
ncbi:gliding motility protein GldI [Formosa agariphila KMM 3901]|uniref:Peptidyl-prolyl cis-trans isomerase n=1 Tax=Formosa agariphila (strain DSM 15362 / KCTC 12365 / LMG 23005 / KMM 3901 / M-2Alg 35-1) TaxID=1347342 RepID=T2KK25_FORAG|nr:gliding motility-associated peptidyl-prolyl isomerase GldI [Formosa agariphila]CDF78771.1 gliding motility protein GldI [Formosa agariphila KMM 3901]